MIVDPGADERLDKAFMALADPVRRRIIARPEHRPPNGQRVGRAVRDHETGHLQTYSGTRSRGFGHSQPRSPEAAGTSQRRNSRGFDRLDRPLSTDPRTTVPQARSPTQHHTEGDLAMATTNPVTITAPEGVPYIDITREFDAPVSAVFAAHSNPDLVKQWLGPNGYEMEIDEYEFVSGGRYKYVPSQPRGRRVPVQRCISRCSRERLCHPDLRIRGISRRRQHRIDHVRGSGQWTHPPLRPFRISEPRSARRNDREQYGARRHRRLRTPGQDRRATLTTCLPEPPQRKAVSWTGPSK